MPTQRVAIYIDGASRGNPGLAGVGVYACDQKTGEELFRFRKFIGFSTNNVAEYLALIYALVELRARGVLHTHIYSDSELLVKQMLGQYRVKNDQLKLFYDLATHLIARLHSCVFEHIPREQNCTADRLANEGVDRRDEAVGK